MADPRSLEGKIALVTGGASGIGLAAVETLVEYGAKVVAADLQDEKGKALESRFGADTVKYETCDVTNLDQLKATIESAEATFGGLDILFNNAGHGGPGAGVEELDADEYDAAMSLLLKAVFFGTKFAIPVMQRRGGGAIVNTSSISALQAGYAPITYSVAKAGVLHFSRMAAAELAPYKIRVNSICPGFIATSIFGASLGLPRDQADQMAEMLAQEGGKMQPAGRVGRGRDIAEMVAFLGSDAGSFITGTNHTVDGGITVGPVHSWNRDKPGPILDALGITPEQAEEMAAAFGNNKG